MKEFRTLTADEIEVRVGTVSNGKANLLLYKDARCDMNILDETVGAMNWKRRHCRDNANCIVSIWDKEKNEWVEKEDTGTESYTEREKGLASDSFKRACVNWGIGRELYTAPIISIKCETVPDGKSFKLKNKWTFFGCKVSSIRYDDKRQITQLTITKDDHVIYDYPNNEGYSQATTTQTPQPLTRDEMRDKIKALAQIKSIKKSEIEQRYSRPISELSKAELEDCMSWLKGV